MRPDDDEEDDNQFPEFNSEKQKNRRRIMWGREGKVPRSLGNRLINSGTGQLTSGCASVLPVKVTKVGLARLELDLERPSKLEFA